MVRGKEKKIMKKNKNKMKCYKRNDEMRELNLLMTIRFHWIWQFQFGNRVDNSVWNAPWIKYEKYREDELITLRGV